MFCLSGVANSGKRWTPIRTCLIWSTASGIRPEHRTSSCSWNSRLPQHQLGPIGHWFKIIQDWGTLKKWVIVSYSHMFITQPSVISMSRGQSYSPILERLVLGRIGMGTCVPSSCAFQLLKTPVSLGCVMATHAEKKQLHPVSFKWSSNPKPPFGEDFGEQTPQQILVFTSAENLAKVSGFLWNVSISCG